MHLPVFKLPVFKLMKTEAQGNQTGDCEWQKEV